MRKSGPGRPPADARRRLLDLGARYRSGADDFFPQPPAAEVTVTSRSWSAGQGKAPTSSIPDRLRSRATHSCSAPSKRTTAGNPALNRAPERWVAWSSISGEYRVCHPSGNGQAGPPFAAAT